MEELSFNCPAYLAQKFWVMCVERGETPGSVLRDFMVREISSVDSGFDVELQTVMGQDVWSICRGERARGEQV
ncbi:MAG: hypothetical protein AAF566_06090 [Pseudomonadota bacterium]